MSRKTSLSSKLSRREPTDIELDASLAEFTSAHDRVAAIVGAALVENSLIDGIKTCIDRDEDMGALFYDDRAPFGTFYARIVAAKAFGLVSARLAEDLHVIRNIRNQFAHSVLAITFENEHIAAECEKLKRFPEWADVRAHASRPRTYYQNGCYTLVVHLMRATNGRLEVRKDDLERRANELKLRILSVAKPELSGVDKLLAAYLSVNEMAASFERG